MGRLTLNVLLSFAQFEREVTGERIRDKIAASKRKGMWMGGVVPLGYTLKDRHLMVDPQEAALVNRIFDLYLKLGCVSKLQKFWSVMAFAANSGPAERAEAQAGSSILAVLSMECFRTAFTWAKSRIRSPPTRDNIKPSSTRLAGTRCKPSSEPTCRPSESAPGRQSVVC